MGFFAVSSMGSRQSWRNWKEAVLLTEIVILSLAVWFLAFCFTQSLLHDLKFAHGFCMCAHFLPSVATGVQRGGLEELRQLGLGRQCNAGNAVHPPQPLTHCWWLQGKKKHLLTHGLL